jgi:nitrous oxidase accessory protein NosD
VTVCASGCAATTIQAGVNLATSGDTVDVGPGVYVEDVNVNKSLTLNGAGADQTTISGAIGGPGTTVQASAAGVVIDGFTITRQGNNVADWNTAGLNSAGVAVQGMSASVELRNSHITGNRTAIDVNRATSLTSA